VPPVRGQREQHEHDESHEQAVHRRGDVERPPQQHPDDDEPDHQRRRDAGAGHAAPGHQPFPSPSTAERYPSSCSRSWAARSLMSASGPANTAISTLISTRPPVAPSIAADVEPVPTVTSSFGSASGNGSVGGPQNAPTQIFVTA